MENRIAFVVGHTEKSKGANSCFNLKEWDFYNIMLNDLVCSANYEFDVFFHDPNIGGYTTRIKNTATRLNKNDYSLVIELHFNSYGERSANGCETLYYYKSKKGRDYAKAFSDLVNQETNIRTRNGGLKALANRKDRGFASVYYPKAPTILIEPFFGSNKHDCTRIKSPANLGRIINKFINNEILNK